jgi:hypothetical protein
MLLTRDEAQRIAANIAKLPRLLKSQSQPADRGERSHHRRLAAN